jgi:two-component system phosphate regulon sensor histidine kinase PhoR
LRDQELEMPRKPILFYAVILFLVTALVGAMLLERPSLGRVALLAATVTLAGLALFVVEVRDLTHVARALATAARRITAGQYGQEVIARGRGDAGELARAFNEMSIRLADQFVALEQDRQQLRAILGGMIEGVVAIDAQQRLLFANERGSKLLEFNPHTAVGLKFWEVVRQRQIVTMVEKALDHGEPEQAEFDWRGNPGKTLLAHVSPLRDKPGGAIIVIHDTSELRRLERLRHEFVANVSHELKTPLAVIRAAVETLQEGAVDDVANRGEFLMQIHDQSERLHHLILDLLSLARIESGAETMEPTLVVVAEAVEECFERHRGRADARRMTLTPALPSEPSSQELRTDDEALAQILDNLVDNAVKYGREGGKITVRWYGVGDQIAFEVEDDGPGIPEEDLPRIFERFYRVDKARSRELGGTGLGLAIVKNLAHILKGSVKVQSEFGKGTTFTVLLPRAPQ